MRRRQDSGYALLLVLLICAMIAITLYKELPRVAFNAERQKEQLLIERGEQYKRAIQLFLRANNNARWPASIDELESFNNKRFLRHRYKDPMTGKDEWRLIHIANGVLTDSVNNKVKKTDDKDKGNGSSSNITAYAGLGQVMATGTASLNPATRRRPSEGGTQVGPDGQPIGGAAGGALAGTPPDLPGGNTPGLAGALPGQGAPSPPGFPAQGQSAPGMSFPGQPGINAGAQPNGMPFTGSQTTGSQASGSQNTSGGSSVGNYGSFGSTTAQPNVPQTNVPAAGGYPGMPGQPANSQYMGGVPAYPTGAGANGMPPSYPNPGMSINPQQNSAAAALIGSLLTSPRPGGMPTAGTAGGNGVMGGGIAGVASKAEGESIMVYADHTNFNEWEFIWDPTKYRPPPNPLQGSIGTAASQLGSMPGTQVGTPASQMGSMPGTSAGTPGGQFGSMQGTPASQMNGPGGGSNNLQPQTPSATGFGAGGAPPDIRPGQQ